MVDPGEEHGDVAEEPVVDLGEALRAYNPRPPVRVRTPEEIWDHWAGLLRQRISARWHNVVVITGEPGCGKSTLALRMARAVDRGFGPDQVAYSAPDMLGLYRRLGYGQVAVYDEAILGLLSNDFQTPEARELVKAVNIVRAKGITAPVGSLTVPSSRARNSWPAIRLTAMRQIKTIRLAISALKIC